MKKSDIVGKFDVEEFEQGIAQADQLRADAEEAAQRAVALRNEYRAERARAVELARKASLARAQAARLETVLQAIRNLSGKPEQTGERTMIRDRELSDLGKKIAKVLAKNPEGMTASQICKVKGISDYSQTAVIHQLKRRPEFTSAVNHNGRSIYTLAS